MEVVILSGAEADLDELHAQAEKTGGGERLLLAVDRELELIRNFPQLVPVSLQARVRRVRIKRTPYGVFYTIEGSRVMILAIQDLRQDPEAIAKAIRRRL